MQQLVLTDVHTHTCPTGLCSIFSFIPGSGSANPPDDVLFSAGLHPWYLSHLYTDERKQVEELCAHPRMVAIGETGIDKIKGPDLEIQADVFSWHLVLASKYALPVIVHQVRAVSEVVKMMQEHSFQLPVIIHGFRGKLQDARIFLDAGCYLSLGLAATKPSAGLTESIRYIPADRLFVETDNYAGPIYDIYKAVSQIRGIEIEALASQVLMNFKHCFNKADGKLG